jgi:mRNA capping enzyme, beta chain
MAARPTTAADETAAALRKFLRQFGHERLELEWRLGMVTATGFRAGVPERAWNAVREVLDASHAFGKAYRETRERVCDGAKLVLPDDVYIFKKRIAVIDEKCDAFVVRACMSIEEMEAAAATAAPPPRPTKFERYKRRWSYRHECWSVDLTRVRSNLPGDRDGDIFEIEIELVDRDVLFVRPLDNVLEWGTGIARDLCAFASI